MSNLKYLTPLLLLMLFVNNVVLSNNCKEDVIVTELIKMCDIGKGGLTALDSKVCQGAALTVYVGQECANEVTITIYMANLNGFDNPGALGQSYNTPAVMPDIYVRYDSELNGILNDYVGPINGFEYRGLNMPSTSSVGQNHYIFEKEIVLFDFATGPDPCSGGISSEIDATVSVELSTYNNNAFQVYDLSPYAGHYDVASCELFMETCGYCITDPTGLSNCTVSDPAYTADICIDCITPCGIDGGRSSNVEEEVFATGLKSVQPNPFRNELEVRFSSNKETDVEIIIMDMQGSIVVQEKTTASIGIQSRILDVDKLPTGIYICQFISEGKSEVVKMIKSI